MLGDPPAARWMPMGENIFTGTFIHMPVCKNNKLMLNSNFNPSKVIIIVLVIYILYINTGYQSIKFLLSRISRILLFLTLRKFMTLLLKI